MRSHPEVVALGLDLSEGMLRTVRGSSQPPGVPLLVVADAQSLPLRTASADVSLLMHMLFHLPDIAQGLTEVDRVLRRGGFVLVSMPGPGHLVQLSRLLMESIAEVRGGTPPPDALQSSTRSGVLDALRHHFRDVESETLTGALSIPDADVVATYIDSVQGPDFEAMLPDPSLWDAVVVTARDQAAASIEEAGAFEVDTAVSLFCCRTA